VEVEVEQLRLQDRLTLTIWQTIREVLKLYGWRVLSGTQEEPFTNPPAKHIYHRFRFAKKKL
jgi:hypothetical protein